MNTIHKTFRKNKTTYAVVNTPYGQCIQELSSFKQGKKASIQTAIDKNEYFRNVCKEKFGINGNDDLSQIEYINSKSKLKVIDNFGVYYISASDYLTGCRSNKLKSEKLKKHHTSNKEDVFRKITKLHPELTILSKNYTSTHSHILVKNNYGICKVKPLHLLQGKKPSVMSSINKNEYFISQAKEVHGDKYNYSLVEYKNNNTKIRIISEYGVFEQLPSNHLNGAGCPVTANNNKHYYTWSHTNWEKAGQKSKNFTGFKVYFLECWDEETNEKFYKIGKTYTDVNKRFKSKRDLPYSYKLVCSIDSTCAKYISEMESKYKNQNKEFKYIPKKQFGGMYECFSTLTQI